SRADSAAAADDLTQQQQPQRPRQRPLVTLDVHPLLPRREIALEQGREAALVQGLESLSLGPERGILSAGGGCDGLQRRLIETGFDEVARIVLHEAAVRVVGQ